VAIAADLSLPEQPSAVFEQVIREFGRLDILVNNAGMSHHAASHEVTVEDMDAVWALNVRAALVLAGKAAERMAADGGGSIVNVSSALSARGIPKSSLYAASKGALDSATRALAAEWAPAGVRVNAIRPAVIRSDMAAGIVDDDDARAYYEKQVPLGRVGEAAEVGETVLFLSSPSASYLTGQIIDIDGGWTTIKPSIFGGIAA
jgi:NAD(P)-dependent dehydrogenase (short-subunit alcohol dehydrogenase family)